MGIEKIVTHSKCNPALLRVALQTGLTQASSGEVAVLMQVLSKILRRASKEKQTSRLCKTSVSKSTCVSQWMSAVVDANLGSLIKSNDYPAMQQVKKEISASIVQTRAILSLKKYLGHVDSIVESKRQNLTNTVDVGSVPLYGIEK